MGDIWSIKEQYKRQMGNLWAPRGDRGIWMGGGVPSKSNVIDYVTISSTGDAADYGDLSSGNYDTASGNTGSRERGFFAGGNPVVDTIQAINLTHSGNASDWGDLTAARWNMGACSNGIRGVYAGGGEPPSRVDKIETFSLAFPSNTTDFGDLSAGKDNIAGCASPTRGIFFGGQTPTKLNVIEYIEFASNSDAIDFGDLVAATTQASSAANSVRGIYAGGDTGSIVNTINYVTIANTGNAVDFGDLTVTTLNPGACSNATRACVAGGNTGATIATSLTNVIGYVTINSGGDAADFGDLTAARHHVVSASNAHGGLSEGEPRGLPVGSGRAVCMGGQVPGNSNKVDMIHIPTLGNASDFGDLDAARASAGGWGSSIRAFSAGGVAPSQIDIIAAGFFSI